MKVLKFGGTSVGSAQRMKEVAKLITDGEQKIVVLSAMSGTTFRIICIRKIPKVRMKSLTDWRLNINSMLMNFILLTSISRKHRNL